MLAVPEPPREDLDVQPPARELPVAECTPESSDAQNIKTL
jgi:hypothetical protein